MTYLHLVRLCGADIPIPPSRLPRRQRLERAPSIVHINSELQPVHLHDQAQVYPSSGPLSPPNVHH